MRPVGAGSWQERAGRAISGLARLAARGRVRRMLWLAAGCAIALSVLVAFRSSLAQGGLAALRGADGDTIVWVLIGGLATNVAGVHLSMRAWRVFVDSPGIDPRATTRIFYIGFLSKFVPGRVWSILAQIDLGRVAGIGARRIVSAFFLSMATGLLAGALIGVATVPLAFDSSLLARVLVVAGTLGAVVVVVWPRLLARAVRWAVTVTGRGHVVEAAPREVRSSMLLAIGGWVLSGAHVGLLASAVGAGIGSALAVGIGAFAAATVVGTLAVVFPDGIGVREVVMTAPLAVVLPLDAAIAVVLVSRLLCLAGEVLLCGTWLLVDRLSRRRPPSSLRQYSPALGSPEGDPAGRTVRAPDPDHHPAEHRGRGASLGRRGA